MTVTITRLFDDYDDAAAAVSDLRDIGVDDGDISLVAGNADDRHGEHSEVREDAGIGAMGGTVVGGAGGLLAGLGMLAIPGLGPVVAAGWLISAAVGAGIGAAAGGVGGGLIGALRDSGESDEDSAVYAEAVRRGGTLVSVKVADSDAPKVKRALDAHRSVAADARGAQYRASGWEPEYDRVSGGAADRSRETTGL